MTRTPRSCWSLEFYTWTGGVTRVKVCPSYGFYLRRNLGQVATRAHVTPELLEETVAEEYYSGGQTAAVFAVREEDIDTNTTTSSTIAITDMLSVYDRNTEAWRQAASKTETAEMCPICFESYSDKTSPREGPLNHPWPTGCTHWACRPCWEQSAKSEGGGGRCPICREDVSQMLASLFPAGPQALAMKASEISMELLLLLLESRGGDSHGECSSAATTSTSSSMVRRGSARGTFSVQDVLKVACKSGPLPDWAGLEAIEPALSTGTSYEVLEGGKSCVAVATSSILLQALRLLGEDTRLRLPLLPPPPLSPDVDFSHEDDSPVGSSVNALFVIITITDPLLQLT